MTVYSQNGFVANDRSLIVAYDVPGGRLALRKGPAGQLLAEAVRRWHTEVEKLQWPGTWGYAERTIRGDSTTLSNHASGTAADCCAPRHPLGTDPAANFRPGQIAAVRRIVGDAEGCLRWGGDYTGRKDGMHLEVIGDEEHCAQVLAHWHGQRTPTAAAASAPKTLRTLHVGMTNDPGVRALQQFIHVHAWHPPVDVPVTGNYADQTVAAVRAVQAQLGVTGPDADGTVVGPRSSAALAKLGASW